MYESRRLLLMGKANNFIAKLKTKEYNYTGEQTTLLLYLIDTMVYGLANIDSDEWQPYLKVFKEAKYKIRSHSKDEQVKRDNYEQAVTALLTALNTYVEYLQSVPCETR